MVHEKDTFRYALPRNVIPVKKVFFRYHNKVIEEVVVFFFFLCGYFSLFYSLGFSIDGFHFLPPKSWEVLDKNQNKYVTENPLIN